MGNRERRNIEKNEGEKHLNTNNYAVLETFL
jgi:hypothetical protein